jgi:hypothetical protein
MHQLFRSSDFLKKLEIALKVTFMLLLLTAPKQLPKVLQLSKKLSERRITKRNLAQAKGDTKPLSYSV